MDNLRIFIGFDPRETIAYHVCVHSIISHSEQPVSITPVMLSQLKGVFTRRNEGTTEFSLSRFLVPYLSGYQGWSLFMDCDMLVQTDIHLVMNEISRKAHKAVYVCKHDYTPRTLSKATGVQTVYPRKNWSSFMLFNNDLCRQLTPEYVNTASGAQLHRFQWLNDDSLIGELPLRWNWLVGEYETINDAYNYHYTLGTPCFEDYAQSDNADLWFKELREALAPMNMLYDRTAYC